MADFQLPAPPLTPGDLYTSGEYTWVWVERDTSGYWQKQNAPVRTTGVADHQILYSDGGVMNGSKEFKYNDDVNQVELASSPLSVGGMLLEITDVNGNQYNSISDGGLYGDGNVGSTEVVNGNFYARKDGKWQVIDVGGAKVTQSPIEPTVPTPTDGDVWFQTDFGRDSTDARQIHVYDGSEFQKFLRWQINDTDTSIPDNGDIATGFQYGDFVLYTYTNPGGDVNLRELFMVLDGEGGTGNPTFFKIGGLATAEEDIRRRPTADADSLIHPLQGGGGVTRVLGLKQEESVDHFLEMTRYNAGVDTLGWRFGEDELTGYDEDENPDVVIQRNAAETLDTEGVIHISLASDGTTTIGDDVPAIRVDIADALVGADDNQRALFVHSPSIVEGNPATGNAAEIIRFEQTGSAENADESPNNAYFRLFRDGSIRIDQTRRFGASGSSHRALRFVADGLDLAGDNQAWPGDKWNILQFELPAEGAIHGSYDTSDFFMQCSVGGESRFSVDVAGTLTAVHYGSCDSSLKSNIAYQNSTAKTTSTAGTEYYGMEKLRSVQAANYTRNADPTGATRLGLIADEVYKVMPDITDVNPDNAKTLDIVGLLATLINAVKELDDRITALGG